MPTSKSPRPKGRQKRGVNSTGRGIAQVRERGVDTSSAAGAALVDPNKPLTEMQKAFVKHWAAGETILSASVKAGYADGGRIAYRMARMPNILALYQEEKRAYERAANMTRERVMEGLLDGVEMARMQGDATNVIGGWKTIGQMCGYFAPIAQKIDVTLNGKLQLEQAQVAKMSDEELMTLILANAQQAHQGLIAGEGGDNDDGTGVQS